MTYSSNIMRMNSGPFQQLEQSDEGGGRSHMSHTWILQLLMALECDAWVGTRNSNWNRSAKMHPKPSRIIVIEHEQM